MFSSPDVWMTFKAAKLTVAKIDEVERRMAECQFVVEPMTEPLAGQLGEAVRSHLFTAEGALRPELSTVTLDPRVPMQRMFAHGAEGVQATTINDIDVLKMVCSHQVDEKTGSEWIRATVHARFDFAPPKHREWIAMYFGYGFYANFESLQGDLLDGGRSAVKQAVSYLQGVAGEDGPMEITGPDGTGVRITKDKVTSIDRGEEEAADGEDDRARP